MTRGSWAALQRLRPLDLPRSVDGTTYGTLWFPLCKVPGCRAWAGFVTHVVVTQGVKHVANTRATQCPEHRAVPAYLRAVRALEDLLDGEHHRALCYCAADLVCEAITILADAHGVLHGTPAVQTSFVPDLDDVRTRLERALADNLWRFVLDAPTFDPAKVRPMTQVGLFADAPFADASSDDARTPLL